MLSLAVAGGLTAYFMMGGKKAESLKEQAVQVKDKGLKELGHK